MLCCHILVEHTDLPTGTAAWTPWNVGSPTISSQWVMNPRKAWQNFPWETNQFDPHFGKSPVLTPTTWKTGSLRPVCCSNKDHAWPILLVRHLVLSRFLFGLVINSCGAWQIAVLRNFELDWGFYTAIDGQSILWYTISYNSYLSCHACMANRFSNPGPPLSPHPTFTRMHSQTRSSPENQMPKKRYAVLIWTWK